MFLALPTYGYQRFNTVAIVNGLAGMTSFREVVVDELSGSLLAMGFHMGTCAYPNFREWGTVAQEPAHAITWTTRA